jgi:hypothetical protein
VAQEPKQTIAIPELNSKEGAAQLTLTTEKYGNGQLVSSAHIYFVRDGLITFEVFGDFRKVLLRTAARATQKALDLQHSSVFTPDAIEALKAEALAFYAAKKKSVA